MRHLLLTLCLLAATVGTPPGARADSAPPNASTKPFELLDGDRVAFIGGTFIEREADACYLETLLTTRFPDRNVTFRNLGYGGDTVGCEARTVCEGWANFGPPDEGFNRLKKLVTEVKPTVMLVGYGMTESFEGEKKLPEFVEGYNRLLDMLTEAAGEKPRFVLIGPNYHENLGRPLPDPAEHNRSLKVYSDAIRQIAAARGGRFVDLFDALKPGPTERLTDNGIHLTPLGYRTAAMEIDQALFGPRAARVELDATGKVLKAEGAKVAGEKAAAPGLAFTVMLDRLPSPPAGTTLVVGGLAPATYRLIGGGERGPGGAAPLLSEAQLAKGVTIATESERVEGLRKLIVAKNADFFHYWRPENDTYILGYRKKEQGRNAVELPEFKPLAVAKEAEIAKLRVPQPVTYTLEREPAAK